VARVPARRCRFRPVAGMAPVVLTSRMPDIRPFRTVDLEALYAVSLATGHEGGDASHLYEDRKLIGHIYAAPYARLDPDFALVACDEHGVAGFAVGTPDTAVWFRRLERDWWPSLRNIYGGSAIGRMVRRSATGLYDPPSCSNVLPDHRALPGPSAPQPGTRHPRAGRRPPLVHQMDGWCGWTRCDGNPPRRQPRQCPCHRTLVSAGVHILVGRCRWIGANGMDGRDCVR
jgi:hypothetical protein